MKITIEINTDNAAFHFNPEIEVARIVEMIGAAILFGKTNGFIDINGKEVGTWKAVGK